MESSSTKVGEQPQTEQPSPAVLADQSPGSGLLSEAKESIQPNKGESSPKSEKSSPRLAFAKQPTKAHNQYIQPNQDAGVSMCSSPPSIYVLTEENIQSERVPLENREHKNFVLNTSKSFQESSNNEEIIPSSQTTKWKSILEQDINVEIEKGVKKNTSLAFNDADDDDGIPNREE